MPALIFGHVMLCRTCKGAGMLTSFGDFYRPATKREIAAAARGDRTARHTIGCRDCDGAGIVAIKR